MVDEFTKAALYWIKTFNKKVKEKIWMEKLIGLLNEYEAKRHKTSVIPQIRKGETRLSYLEMNWSYSELLCISKRYGFIKRLVDNDKIDDYIINDAVMKKEWIDEREEYDYVFPTKYEQLLMLLSISDTPIEDLISYLK